MSAAGEKMAPAPMTAVASQLFDAASANGKGDLDHSALVTVYETLANWTLDQDGEDQGINPS
jgi:hypothetical protein